MAQKRKRKHLNITRWIVRMILVVLLVAAGVIVYLVWDNYFNDKKEENPTAESSEVEEKEPEEKKIDEPEVELTGASVEKSEVKQYEGEDPNVSEELTGVITYAGVSSGVLRIRVNIDQYLSEGNCELSLVQNGVSVYSLNANIVGSAATATCEGFDVSTGGLSGNYQVVIKLSSGNKIGTVVGEANV